MALITCPECRKAVSNHATTCPHCGFPISQALVADSERKSKKEGSHRPQSESTLPEDGEQQGSLSAEPKATFLDNQKVLVSNPGTRDTVAFGVAVLSLKYIRVYEGKREAFCIEKSRVKSVSAWNKKALLDTSEGRVLIGLTGQKDLKSAKGQFAKELALYLGLPFSGKVEAAPSDEKKAQVGCLAILLLFLGSLGVVGLSGSDNGSGSGVVSRGSLVNHSATRPSRFAESDRVQTAWYEGGTLHKSSVREWTSASRRNRLATSADFVTAFLRGESLPFPGADAIRPAAAGIDECIVTAANGGSAGSRSRITLNMRSSEAATLCWMLMKSKL